MSDKERQDKYEQYFKESWELEQAIIAEIGEEAWEANQHWVNNPLIKPVSKVVIFDNHVEFVKDGQRKYLVNLLKEEIQKVSEPMMVDKEFLDGLERAIEIIEGADK